MRSLESQAGVELTSLLYYHKEYLSERIFAENNLIHECFFLLKFLVLLNVAFK
jgi:hypothetical protein